MTKWDMFRSKFCIDTLITPQVGEQSSLPSIEDIEKSANNEY